MLKHKLIVGTAQLGMDYGINNQSGKPTEENSLAILDYAYSRGIASLDTADAYGTSQSIIGRYCQGKRKFNIFSKFSFGRENPLATLPKTLAELNVPQINCYSFHSFSELEQAPKSLAERLRQTGLTESVGVSVYSDDELDQSITFQEIDVIQVPFSLLDCGPRKRELIAKAKEYGKTVHVRSIFLQGLFFMDRTSIPAVLESLIEPLTQVDEIAARYGISVHELCIMFPLLVPEIDGVIVGVESRDQLEENVTLIRETHLSHELLDEIYDIRCDNPVLLNPSNWH